MQFPFASFPNRKHKPHTPSTSISAASSTLPPAATARSSFAQHLQPPTPPTTHTIHNYRRRRSPISQSDQQVDEIEKNEQTMLANTNSNSNVNSNQFNHNTNSSSSNSNLNSLLPNGNSNTNSNNNNGPALISTFHRSASFNGRRRGPVVYPPIVRNLQKQTRPYSLVTILLIILPFAVAVLFTVDFRTQLLSSLKKDTSLPSSKASVPKKVVASNNNNLQSPNIVKQPNKPPVSVSDSSSTSSTTNSIVKDSASTTTNNNVVQQQPPPPQIKSETKPLQKQAPPQPQVVAPAAPVVQQQKPPSASEPIIEGVSGKTNMDNGIPPRSLPLDHPNRELLESIRARTKMTPRWPYFKETQSAQLRTYGQAYSSILVSHKLKVIYVPVFKVATTSMMWTMAYLENNEIIMQANKSMDTGQLMKIIHDMSSSAWHPSHTIHHMPSTDISKYFDNPEYLKFGFVRNPYDRIVSAYVDKVMRPEISNEEYQDQMYSLYGNDPVIRKKYNETRPTFLEFLGSVKKLMALPRVKSNDVSSPDAYEDNRSRRDMHWRPQVELLHPDIIHLDFVGKFDRINEDRQYVLEWMHRHSGERKIATTKSRKLHSTDPKHKLELFDKLRADSELRNLLLTIYKEDFSRFQFSTEVPTGRE